MEGCDPHCVTVEEYTDKTDFIYVIRFWSDILEGMYVKIYNRQGVYKCYFTINNQEDLQEYMTLKCDTINNIENYRLSRIIWQEQNVSY